MSDRIDMEIVTPERRVIAETVDELILPGTQGYLGVLPGHAPLLTALTVGELAYRIGKDFHYLAISGGFAEILRDRVSILAETCERAEEIDVDRAERSKERAEETLGSSSESEFELAAARLKRAVTRIQVHGKRVPT